MVVFPGSHLAYEDTCRAIDVRESGALGACLGASSWKSRETARELAGRGGDYYHRGGLTGRDTEMDRGGGDVGR